MKTAMKTSTKIKPHGRLYEFKGGVMEVKVAGLKELLHWRVRILYYGKVVEFETHDLRLETITPEAQKRFNAIG